MILKRKRITEFLESISNEELSDLIDKWIKHERNRNMLKRRIIDCVCFEPLAEEFNLSVRQTKNIIYKSEEQLFKHIL